MVGLVKLKSHEGVGCDVTPEGGNDCRADRQVLMDRSGRGGGRG